MTDTLDAATVIRDQNTTIAALRRELEQVQGLARDAADIFRVMHKSDVVGWLGRYDAATGAAEPGGTDA